MTSHDAPAIGGASGSTFSTHSAWNPYSVLPASIKRRVSNFDNCSACVANSFVKIDPKSSLPPAASFLTTLSIPENVANERLNSKYVQLEPPIGKESDWRKLELATRAEEKLKKKSRAIRKGDCGLIGRRKRKRLSKEDEKIIRLVLL